MENYFCFAVKEDQDLQDLEELSSGWSLYVDVLTATELSIISKWQLNWPVNKAAFILATSLVH